jgi:putative DNA primase/helicase
MELLKYLSKGGNGYFWVKGAAGPAITIWFTPGKIPPAPAGKVNVYFGVNPCKTQKGPNERALLTDLAGVNCLFAEFDAKDFNDSKTAASQHIDRLLLPPNVVIDSGGGFHCYWLLKETFVINTQHDLEYIKNIQASWVPFVGGDRGAKDLARVLRVPGTLNFKYTPPRVVTEIYGVFDDLLYNLGDLATAPGLTQPEPAPSLAPAQPAPSTQQAGEHWLQKAVSMATEGNRNHTGFWLACQLRDSDLAIGQAESILLAYAGLVRNGRNGTYKDNEARASVKSAYTAPAREGARGTLVVATPKNGNGAHPAPAEKIELNKLLITAPFDHYGHALCFMKKYPDNFSFVEQWGWLAYNGQFWKMEGAEPEVNRNVVETLKARRMAAVAAENESLVKITKANNTNVNGTREVLRNYVGCVVAQFDDSPDHLNCANGVVNLRSGQLVAHSPSQKFTYCVPYDYRPGTDYTQWVNWLGQATTAPLDYLQAAAGYSITGHTWEEILFYLYGEPRSGKGTFTETLLTLLGQPVSTEADFQTFTADRTGDTQNFDLAHLKPCRFVAAAESKKNQPLNPAKIKQLTGRNMVRCAYKHKDHFVYQPAFKIWLSSNYPVNLDVDDDAAWGRVKIISFPHSHLGKEDKTLKMKMASKENLQAVLCWLVEGAQKWYQFWNTGQGLKTPNIVDETTEGQRAQQDLIRAFLNECTQPEPESFVISKNLYSAYSEWCQANGAPTKYINQFTQILARKGYKPEIKRINYKTHRVITGLKLGSDIDKIPF